MGKETVFPGSGARKIRTHRRMLKLEVVASWPEFPLWKARSCLVSGGKYRWVLDT